MATIDKDEAQTYVIPENFVDEGRIIRGMFKTRNFIEGAVMALLVGFFANMIPTKDIASKISTMMFCCGPFFMIGVTGFNGDSLFQTAKNAYSWAKERMVFLYNGNARALSKSPLEAMMEQDAPSDIILNVLDKFKDERAKKKAEIAYIEGENFEFERDSDLEGIYADEAEDDDEDDDEIEAHREAPSEAHEQNEEASEVVVIEDIEEVEVVNIAIEASIADVENLDFASEVNTKAPKLETKQTEDDRASVINIPISTELDIDDEEVF